MGSSRAQECAVNVQPLWHQSSMPDNIRLPYCDDVLHPAGLESHIYGEGDRNSCKGSNCCMCIEKSDPLH